MTAADEQHPNSARFTFAFTIPFSPPFSLSLWLILLRTMSSQEVKGRLIELGGSVTAGLRTFSNERHGIELRGTSLRFFGTALTLRPNRAENPDDYVTARLWVNGRSGTTAVA